MNYFSRNSDKLLVGWSLGPVALGLLSLAFRVLQVVIQLFGQVGRVIFPTFARLQDDRERLARVFLRVSESTRALSTPAMTLVVALRPCCVPMVFGEAWSGQSHRSSLLAAMTVPYFGFAHRPADNRRWAG